MNDSCTHTYKGVCNKIGDANANCIDTITHNHN